HFSISPLLSGAHHPLERFPALTAWRGAARRGATTISHQGKYGAQPAPGPRLAFPCSPYAETVCVGCNRSGISVAPFYREAYDSANFSVNRPATAGNRTNYGQYYPRRQSRRLAPLPSERSGIAPRAHAALAHQAGHLRVSGKNRAWAVAPRAFGRNGHDGVRRRFRA